MIQSDAASHARRGRLPPTGTFAATSICPYLTLQSRLPRPPSAATQKALPSQPGAYSALPISPMPPAAGCYWSRTAFWHLHERPPSYQSRGIVDSTSDSFTGDRSMTMATVQSVMAIKRGPSAHQKAPIHEHDSPPHQTTPADVSASSPIRSRCVTPRSLWPRPFFTCAWHRLVQSRSAAAHSPSTRRCPRIPTRADRKLWPASTANTANRCRRTLRRQPPTTMAQ